MGGRSLQGKNMPEDESKHNAEILEKIRVLTCLYLIAQKAVDDSDSFDVKLRDIVDLIPQAFESPEKIVASIHIDGKNYHTKGFDLSLQRSIKDIIVNGEVRGSVEIGRIRNDAQAKEAQNSFSLEETRLMDSASRKIAYLIERREAKEKKELLEEQLLHADRLATIGQLAAGMAHELNNPLGDILGFAQLASNSPDLPEAVYQDLEKIVKSALYAREVIKKVLLFSRQTSVSQAEINLNQLIENWMDFFEFRCAQNNIEIVLKMDAKLPAVNGDPAQLNQVLVNLVVNAIHAMSDGGVLTMTTGIKRDLVFMKVEDTGTGIQEEIKNKIFLPFFTTKDVDQGTGLGLSVVYGIINEHGGVVNVDSRVGEGSTFEIQLPIFTN